MKQSSPTPANPMLIEHLISEISHVSEQQTDALDGAAFVGMTENELRVYDERRKKLRELVHELEVLTSRKAA